MGIKVITGNSGYFQYALQESISDGWEILHINSVMGAPIYVDETHTKNEVTFTAVMKKEAI